MAVYVGRRGEFLRTGEAAKMLRVSRETVHRLITRGTLAAIWRNNRCIVSAASVEAYARRLGVAAPASDDKIDAMIFALLRQGESDEAIVTALEVPLDRVLRLRQHRDGKREDDPATKAFEEERAAQSRQAALSQTLERDRAERRKRLG